MRQDRLSRLADYMENVRGYNQFVNLAKVLNCPPGTTKLRITAYIEVEKAGRDGGGVKTFGAETEVNANGTINRIFGEAYGEAVKQAREKGYRAQIGLLGQTQVQGVVKIGDIDCL